MIMPWNTSALFSGIMIAFLTLTPAHAEKRVALVVGNANYVHIPKLENPISDARLMAETLRTLGFSLVGGGPQLNLDESGFRRAVQTFGDAATGADVALFYFAGHGVQVRGANYLVPVGANPVREADVDFQMLDTSLVLRQMESAGARLNLVILDACRNNPFGGRGLRSVAPGLAQMQAPQGTLISFATQPGNVALDGRDGNSPYTRALAQAIKRPGVDIFRTFNEVGLAVASATGGSQQPWVSLSPIKGDFYFAGGPPNAPTPDPAAQAWAATQNTNSVAILEDFIRQFGSTPYGSMARARLNELKKNQMAVVAPPVTPPASVREKPKPATGIFPPALRNAPLSSERERALKPRDSFKECDMCPEVVVVPAGSFLMGSAASSDPDMYIEEAPQHRVTIARPFAVGKFEITVDQFSAFVNETGYDTGSKCWTAEDGNTEQERTGRSFKNPGFAQDGSHPAVCLNWTDAKTYTEWLSKKTGRPYRLLTEAEWEYSARAGTATTYHFGNNRDELCQHGNGLDRTAKRSLPNASEWAIAECEDGFAHTAPVGRFAANAFGLHDFHGNVWELTEDCWNWSYNGAPADGSAWLGGRCNPGVRRGGSWRSHPKMLRSANRIDGHSTNRYDTIGIRIGRTLLAP